VAALLANGFTYPEGQAPDFVDNASSRQRDHAEW
jgi:hypothetical protein